MKTIHNIFLPEKETLEQYNRRMAEAEDNAGVYLPKTFANSSNNNSPAEQPYVSPKLFDKPRTKSPDTKSQSQPHGEQPYRAPQLGDVLKGGKK